MALTESNMLPLGTVAPDFELLNVVKGDNESLNQLKGEKGTLIVFMCNHCPYVVYLLDSIISNSKKWKQQGITTIGISSNSIHTHPQDGPENMASLAVEKEFGFPYLFDATQAVAKAYDAACTPDFYLFDATLELHYRGRYDGSRPGNDTAIDGTDLQEAIDTMITKKTPLAKQWPSMGCNIKWEPGKAPESFHS